MASETYSSTSGRVKWFNNKAGYGFISVTDCETSEERDIFVHHTEIHVGESQYKYLVQGEYVDFHITPITRKGSDGVNLHATDVRGRDNGKLMCETHNDARTQRTMPLNSSTHYSNPRPQGNQYRRPQLDKADQTEWMIVPRRRPDTTDYAQAPAHQQVRSRVTAVRPRQRQPQIEIE
jgi:cold shock CspA family protein